LQNFEEVIKKINNYTRLVALHVKGEPLLHSDLEQILKILDKYNLKTNITTNGTLIKDKLETIKNSKAVRQINFSIHSMLQNENLNKQYLNDIFESVEKLKDVIISYRLWNLQNINDNTINNDIIKQIEDYYNIQNLKQQLHKKNQI
jgi:molybdenum cofactor biosynthesis enzyme MoaA